MHHPPSYHSLTTNKRQQQQQQTKHNKIRITTFSWEEENDGERRRGLVAIAGDGLLTETTSPRQSCKENVDGEASITRMGSTHEN
ncbi:hypothetical protein GUJ93_ZPchr0005g14880 [Zizania palustris]|uniref:Uncharacterized protein n=1 Tax=Zizania palustris TaxID=103762 RepID=A0A8J5T2A6_ZIZPA|nr:hypothetical protein GUJ93_ZPchr0005g14880 [Zizania palustris]